MRTKDGNSFVTTFLPKLLLADGLSQAFASDGFVATLDRRLACRTERPTMIDCSHGLPK